MDAEQSPEDVEVIKLDLLAALQLDVDRIQLRYRRPVEFDHLRTQAFDLSPQLG
ncbi:hypothetical protein D3C86_1443930 [compost metagenome]